METQTTASLTPHDKNPRKITEQGLERLKKTIEKFGDLSGLIYNRKTKKMVGGHQRLKVFGPDCAIEYSGRHSEPDSQGTMSWGWVVLKDGSRHPYREVRWDDATEHAAMILANTNAGEWEETLLRENLVLVAEGGFEVEETGLTGEFTEKLFRDAPEEPTVGELEDRFENKPVEKGDMKLLPSQTLMVQLFMTVKTRPPFMDVVQKLRENMGAATTTETIERVVYAFAKAKGIYPEGLEPKAEEPNPNPFGEQA